MCIDPWSHLSRPQKGGGNGENKEQSEEDKEEQSEKDDEKKPIDVTPKCHGKDCSPHADPELIIARDIEVVLLPVSGLEEKESDGNGSGEDEKPKQYKHNPSQGNCMIKVTIPDKDQSFTDQEQFEIISFVDDQFIEEVEAGISLPYDYTWDMSNIKKGSHILTVNVAGLKDHLGTASLAVEIEE